MAKKYKNNSSFLLFLILSGILTYFIIINLSKNCDSLSNTMSDNVSNNISTPDLNTTSNTNMNYNTNNLLVSNEPFYDGCGTNRCICSKMSEKVCINNDAARSYYNAGLITENTIPPNGISNQQFAPYL
jgi:hypothetical protein